MDLDRSGQLATAFCRFHCETQWNKSMWVPDSGCRGLDRESCSCTVAVFMERNMVLVLYEVMEAAEMNGLGIIDLSKYLVHTVRSQVIASTQRKHGDPCSTTPTNECLSPSHGAIL